MNFLLILRLPPPPQSDAPLNLKRAIAFTNTIRASKSLAKHWDDIIEHAVARLPEEERERAADFRCETDHVDGQHHALERKKKIDWLKEGSGKGCRILSNARCLSEGVDVPALDAVLFMNPRNSLVDVVQGVGRAMRKSGDKKYGYIILPIAVPPDMDPATALDKNEQFEVVWSVLRALRSHDERLDAEINALNLNQSPSERIIFTGRGTESDGYIQQLPFPPLDLPPNAFYAKVVEKCGDRRYLESWAKDVADIFARLTKRIGNLLDNNKDLRFRFGKFVQELKSSLNDSIDEEAAISMLAQHMITRPIFDALFQHYDFAGRNPVAQALGRLQEHFEHFGLENETRDLKPLYESVRRRASGLDNADARQEMLNQLYEHFFKAALKEEANRLGIAYTPHELVDFILHSADHMLKQEFGKGLTDRGVHVLDPFAGTGTFLVRLLRSGLLREQDLERKFREELHANEILLLAYYIAAIHIEEAYHGRREANAEYEPFRGIVLTDTFNLRTEDSRQENMWMPANSERVERQQNQPIQVIVGNPPWSMGNENISYDYMEERIGKTYAAHTVATRKSSLYDTYKMAIRWASDRIGEQGVIAFVTNGSWIDGKVDAGLRACLVDEFASVHILNLRGNIRAGRNQRKTEGENVFGQASQARVTVIILVRKKQKGNCNIAYWKMDDAMKREEKFAMLNRKISIADIQGWQKISPDEHHDWISQRNSEFQDLMALGSKERKSGGSDQTIFTLYSMGTVTARDAYLYNFSHKECADRARKMIYNFNTAVEMLGQNPQTNIEAIAAANSTNLRWDRELRNKLKRGISLEYKANKILKGQYRPFIKQYCYTEYTLMNNKYKMDQIFGKGTIDNQVICVTGVSSTEAFSALMVNSIPDLHCVGFGQCFPRYRYEKPKDKQEALTGMEPGPEKIDNITDTALRMFRAHYDDPTIRKDNIFDYVYGVLHAPDYREKFANDLTKELPRIPFAPDFRAFAKAGRALAELHLNYESCEEYPLPVADEANLAPADYRLGTSRMRLQDDGTTLHVNDRVRLTGIPAGAHDYVVNGRTPLEWFVARYHIKVDKKSRIVNDPNEWFEGPRDIVAAIRRIVHVSVESARIVAALPGALEET